MVNRESFKRPHAGLLVWQDAMELVEMVYDFSGSFPDDERFGLTAKIRRAAVSIPSNIAEGAALEAGVPAVSVHGTRLAFRTGYAMPDRRTIEVRAGASQPAWIGRPGVCKADRPAQHIEFPGGAQ